MGTKSSWQNKTRGSIQSRGSISSSSSFSSCSEWPGMLAQACDHRRIAYHHHRISLAGYSFRVKFCQVHVHAEKICLGKRATNMAAVIGFSGSSAVTPPTRDPLSDGRGARCVWQREHRRRGLEQEPRSSNGAGRWGKLRATLPLWPDATLGFHWARASGDWSRSRSQPLGIISA